MKKVGMLVGGIAVLLLIAGAGCAEVDNPSAQDDSLKNEESTNVVNPATSEFNEEKSAQGESALVGQDNELNLSAEAIGENSVKFLWTAPKNLTEANRFIIVQGTEENPAHDGKHNWFRQYYANRAVVWANLSGGKHHFRICITENNNNDSCVRYSNDVEVKIE